MTASILESCTQDVDISMKMSDLEVQFSRPVSDIGSDSDLECPTQHEGSASKIEGTRRPY
jgi:hypothetical protein